MAEERGVWRTIKGRRVFIREGEDLASAMKRSGKFDNLNNKPRTISKEEYDKKPKDYKGTLKELVDTAKFRGENPDELRKEYEKMGYDVDKDKTILELGEDGGTRLSPVKIAEDNKYETDYNFAKSRHIGFGQFNKDGVPVYDNKIDNKGDFGYAKLSTLSNEELTKALNVQSQEYHNAINENLGDQRTRNGRMNKIFNTAKIQKYEEGMNLINEEMKKRNMPRYDIYNNKNNMLMASSPTKEIADRQLKEMYDTDKSLQKHYGWKELPEYRIESSQKAKIDSTKNWKKQIEINNKKMEKDVTDLQNKINEYRNKSYQSNDALERHQYWREAEKLQDKYYERFRENERANAKIKIENPNEKYMNIEAYAGYKDKFNSTWGEDGSESKVVSAKMYTNDEFMEHLEDANWHSERRQLLDANLTNKELEYIKNRTNVSAWGVENLTGKEQVEGVIKEAKARNAGSLSNMSLSELRKTAQEYNIDITGLSKQKLLAKLIAIFK